MDRDELIKLLDERDEARRALKKSKKAKKAEIEAPAQGQQSEDAAKATAPSQPAPAGVDAEALTKAVTAGVAEAIKGLETRLAQVENTPVKPVTLNGSGVAAGVTAPVLRGQDDIAKGAGADDPAASLASLEAAFSKSTDPEEKSRLGRELTVAKITINERRRLGVGA